MDLSLWSNITFSVLGITSLFRFLIFEWSQKKDACRAASCNTKKSLLRTPQVLSTSRKPQIREEGWFETWSKCIYKKNLIQIYCISMHFILSLQSIIQNTFIRKILLLIDKWYIWKNTWILYSFESTLTERLVEWWIYLKRMKMDESDTDAVLFIKYFFSFVPSPL